MFKLIMVFVTFIASTLAIKSQVENQVAAEAKKSGPMIVESELAQAAVQNANTQEAYLESVLGQTGEITIDEAGEQYEGMSTGNKVLIWISALINLKPQSPRTPC